MQQDVTLVDRVAIVTGSSRGIGAAIAERLASAGATVVLAARSIDASADGLAGTVNEVVERIAANGGKGVAIACDVEDEASRAALIEQVARRFGRIDILVNNAGRAQLDTVEEMQLSGMRSQAEQYLFAPLHLSLLAAEHMKRRGEGWIVNLGSSSALPIDVEAMMPTTGGRTLAFYGAVKAAIHRASSGFALGFAPFNIAVNVVAPVAVVGTPGVRAAGIVTAAIEHYLERVEHMAEATLALVSRPPREQTGVVAFSYTYLDAIGRSTMSLDGREIVEARGADAQVPA